jgi:hypothetical protein
MQLWGVPTRLLAVFMLLSSMALIATDAAAQTPAPAPAKAPAATTGIPPAKVSKTWTGDFYFVDRAVQRGLSYEVTQLLEADLNKKLKTGNIKVHEVCIPVTQGRDDPGPARGPRGHRHGQSDDHPERLKQVDFTEPTGRNVVEIVVTGPGAEPIGTVEDLSGKEVYLRKSSSYYQSIETLNAELAKGKKPPVKVRLAPEQRNEDRPRCSSVRDAVVSRPAR